MEQKYVRELKMLAIISVTNLNDLQTHIFLFIILISAFLKNTRNIARIGFDIDHIDCCLVVCLVAP